MSEYRKEIAVRGVAATIAVLFLASLVYYVPLGTNSGGPATLTTTHTVVVPAGLFTITSTGGGSSSTNDSKPGPALLLGVATSDNVSCSKATGTCSMTIVNGGTSSSFDIVAVACDQSVVTSINSTTTVYSDAHGVVGGRIVAIPYGTDVVLTCSIPTTQLSLQPSGSTAMGSILVELINTLYRYPPGTLAHVGFEGTWT